ncbi:hypothetical protein Btru_062206 [Bulinus truncatus]|nr:hypothetical protein Btru_062206 [Bulinus truncatus]
MIWRWIAKYTVDDLQIMDHLDSYAEYRRIKMPGLGKDQYNIKCSKNPFHKNFYSLDELTYFIKTLPKPLRTDKVERLLRLHSKLVVKVEFEKNGINYSGSGFV